MGNEATASAQFTIELEDETSGACKSAEDALEQLRTAIKGDTAELASMQRAMKNLQGATVVNVKQFKELNASIAAKKASIGEAQSNYLALGGSFQSTAKKASSSGDAIGKLEAKLAAMKKQSAATGKAGASSLEMFSKQAKLVPGPLGQVVSKFSELRALVAGGGISVGLVAIAVGIAAVTAATIFGIAKLTEYGIAQGDARRSELLRIEGLTKVRNWYGLAAGNAKEMQAAIDKVAASSAASREQVAGYSDELYRMGLRGTNLTAALEGVAIKSTTQGEAAAHAFAGWTAGAARTGQSVRKLADDVKARLGGIAAKQMQSLTVQAQKQKESFDALFSGVNVEAYVAAKKTVGDLISQTTNSGRALKALLTSVVQPIVDMAAKSQPIIKRFFQGMIIESLRLGIQFQMVRLWWKRTFAQPDVLKGVDKMNAALVTGRVVLYTVAAALAFAAGSAIAFTWPVLLAAAAIWGVYEVATDLYQLWNEIDWADLGKAIGDGIVSGVKKAWSKVVEVTKDLGTAAWTAFKQTLGISSPSKVFARLGLAIPQGVSAGVDIGTPQVQRSVDDMIDVPRIPAERAADGGSQTTSSASGAASGGTVNNITFTGDINLDGSKGGRAQAIDFMREVERIFEGVSIQIGAPIVGDAA
jgi:hypothetical protein